MSFNTMFKQKESIATYIEKGFYVGVAGIVGASVAVALPEIAVVCTLGVVGYKLGERAADVVRSIRK